MTPSFILKPDGTLGKTFKDGYICVGDTLCEIYKKESFNEDGTSDEDATCHCVYYYFIDKDGNNVNFYVVDTFTYDDGTVRITNTFSVSYGVYQFKCGVTFSNGENSVFIFIDKDLFKLDGSFRTLVSAVREYHKLVTGGLFRGYIHMKLTGFPKEDIYKLGPYNIGAMKLLPDDNGTITVVTYHDEDGVSRLCM
jgi:hypothetical protein